MASTVIFLRPLCVGISLLTCTASFVWGQDSRKHAYAPDEIHVDAEDPLDPEFQGNRRWVWDDDMHAIQGTIEGLTKDARDPAIRHRVIIEDRIVRVSAAPPQAFRSKFSASEGELVPVGGAIGLLGKFEGPPSDSKVQRGGRITRLRDAAILKQMPDPAGRLPVVEGGSTGRRIDSTLSYFIALESTHRDDAGAWAVVRTSVTRIDVDAAEGRRTNSSQKLFKRVVRGDEFDVGERLARFRVEGIAVKGEPDERIVGWITLTPIEDNDDDPDAE